MPWGLLLCPLETSPLEAEQTLFPQLLQDAQSGSKKGSTKAAVGPDYRAYNAIRASACCALKLETGSSAEKLVTW